MKSYRPQTRSQTRKPVPQREIRSRVAPTPPKIEHEEPAKKGPVLRIIPLGGLEEVGRNMTVFEYGDDIIIVDIGLRFPEENMPGIDFIIPNIEYLKDKKEKIRGVIITHAHYDHIGAIPYIIDKIGYPPIWATPLSKGIILKRQEDYPRLRKLDIRLIDKNNPETIQLGVFTIDPFHLNHNIPDAVGLSIQTPAGQILHTTDFKIDFAPIADKPADLGRIVQLASRGTLLYLSDSTGVENPGHSLSESVIYENLEEVFENAQGRIIVATFASLISRIQQVLWLAEKTGRKVAVEGYSMKSNLSIARELGYIKHARGTIISSEEALRLPANKVAILCTGAQGEDKAVLMRVVNKEHRHFRIQPGDTVIFSSSIIPGNERVIQNLKDSLYRQGAEVFHYKMMDIHASGHAYAEELKLMLNLIKPQFFMPIHGEYSMLRSHAKLAERLGIPKENIIVAPNGSVVEVTPEKVRLTPQHVPADMVMVDGLGVGDVGEVVLRDRQTLAQDGILIVVGIVDIHHGRLRQEPDIISRGFVYMRESKELVGETKHRAQQIIDRGIASGNGKTINDLYIKNKLRDELGDFLFHKTQRRPMILPVLISV